MRPNQLGKSRRCRTFLLKAPMARHRPSRRQCPADEHESETEATACDNGQPDMPAQLGEQQRRDDPADSTRISLMRLGKAFGPPAGEVGISTEQDQPRNRGHGDIDARHAGLD